MKRNFKTFQLLGFIFVSISGTLLHFLYDWSNKNKFVAIFSGVNESTWEHMKLLYFPLLILGILQYNYFKNNKKFWCIKLIGTVTGLLSIPIIFYTYNGVFGKSPDFVNILIFFISAAITLIFEGYLFKNDSIKCKKPLLSFLLLCSIGVLFLIFTFYTPKLPIFLDPVSKKYGIF